MVLTMKIGLAGGGRRPKFNLTCAVEFPILETIRDTPTREPLSTLRKESRDRRKGWHHEINFLKDVNRWKLNSLRGTT